MARVARVREVVGLVLCPGTPHLHGDHDHEAQNADHSEDSEGKGENFQGCRFVRKRQRLGCSSVIAMVTPAGDSILRTLHEGRDVRCTTRLGSIESTAVKLWPRRAVVRLLKAASNTKFANDRRH
ncbi:hypothetical protein CH063_02260 [Colletotrichum higginsianum]|uniref:Uncharacterized protein n=1 Tax=Colletotrichum higginsianum (strain IMI 349063) TaxID=759273 RepID=H1VIG2_COLHI|nr:hypothetical protein CH063_02260 [Colletotrichum higginsianum]